MPGAGAAAVPGVHAAAAAEARVVVVRNSRRGMARRMRGRSVASPAGRREGNLRQGFLRPGAFGIGSRRLIVVVGGERRCPQAEARSTPAAMSIPRP